MSKLTIQKLYINKLTTKYGEKEKYDLYFKEKPSVKVDCWKSNYNSDWKIGDVIEVEASQWQSREYKGKTYWTLKAPESAKQGGYVNTTKIEEQLNLLAERVAGIERTVVAIQMQTEKPVAEEEPPAEAYSDDEINVKSIPF